jgi:predicted peroxiredoxin
VISHQKIKGGVRLFSDFLHAIIIFKHSNNKEPKMKKIKQILMALSMTIFIMGSGTAFSASMGPAPEGCAADELFLSLSTDDTWRANMALNFAMRNLELGYPVTVFLSVEAVHLALRKDKYPQNTYGLTGKTAQQVIKKLSKKGGRVIVCPNCLKRAGFKPRHLIGKVYLGGPVPQILQCSSKQLSF